jgi:hypothetical protein
MYRCEQATPQANGQRFLPSPPDSPRFRKTHGEIRRPPASTFAGFFSHRGDERIGGRSGSGMFLE